MIKKTYSFIKNGVENDVYTLSNNFGASAQILTYGARLVSLSVPTVNGDFLDVLVGPKTPESFYDYPDYYGATVGRVANRIEKGTFTLNGKQYFLDINQGNHSLHGGNTANFDRAVWQAEVSENSLVLYHFSKDGSGGYPGNLQVWVTYTLTEENALEIDYYAKSDKDTVCSLTNHAFFCLSKEKSVKDSLLYINSNTITPVDNELVTHGQFRNILGTAFDFSCSKPIGADIESDEPMIERSKGYDVNYCINRKTPKDLELCATLFDGKTRIKLECFTTMPGVHLYSRKPSGKYLTELGYPENCSVCLETQYYPNSPNCDTYPSVVLRAGQEYKHKTVYKFSLE